MIVNEPTEHDYTDEFIAFLRIEGVTIRDMCYWLYERGLQPTFCMPEGDGSFRVNGKIALTHEE